MPGNNNTPCTLISSTLSELSSRYAALHIHVDAAKENNRACFLSLSAAGIGSFSVGQDGCSFRLSYTCIGTTVLAILWEDV
jgi:hypothetical protein